MTGHELSAAVAPMGGPPRGLAPRTAWRELHRGASERYRVGGRFALHFARGKLGRDPVFRALLERAVVPPGARVLDIGCGQALLAGLLAQCDALAAAGQWPATWGAAPSGARYCGIDLMPRDIARAERALASLPTRPQLVCGDMRVVPFEPCDVVVVLDVLHYVDVAEQLEVLKRIRAALQPRGRLLLRVGDAAQTLRFRVSQWVDHAVTLTRGHRAAPVSVRPLAEWRTLLASLGFAVHAVPMSHGTPFANVLLVCDLEPAAR